MRLKSPGFAIAVCTLAASTLVARADWFRDTPPPPNARPLSSIIKAVEDRGLGTITEVEFEDGKWEIELHQASGKEIEIHVDPISGQIVRNKCIKVEGAMTCKSQTRKGCLVTALALTICNAEGAQAEYRPSVPNAAAGIARDTCAIVMRIRPGFVTFDACVDSLAQTLAESRSTPTPLGEKAIADLSEQTSFSQSTQSERRQKEEQACAQLGVLIGTSRFSQCVSQLDSALRSTEQHE